MFALLFNLENISKKIILPDKHKNEVMYKKSIQNQQKKTKLISKEIISRF